jgi:hypothetical protein
MVIYDHNIIYHRELKKITTDQILFRLVFRKEVYYTIYFNIHSSSLHQPPLLLLLNGRGCRAGGPTTQTPNPQGAAAGMNMQSCTCPHG